MKGWTARKVIPRRATARHMGCHSSGSHFVSSCTEERKDRFHSREIVRREKVEVASPEVVGHIRTASLRLSESRKTGTVVRKGSARASAAVTCRS